MTVEEIIGRELLKQALEARVWLAIKPEDARLQKFAEDTANTLDEYVMEHPELQVIFKEWYDSLEDVCK